MSKIAQVLKSGSLKWIHETFATLTDLAWQDGYGAFSVSRSQLPDVELYIATQQREHHRKFSPRRYATRLRIRGFES